MQRNNAQYDWLFVRERNQLPILAGSESAPSFKNARSAKVVLREPARKGDTRYICSWLFFLAEVPVYGLIVAWAHHASWAGDRWDARADGFRYDESRGR